MTPQERAMLREFPLRLQTARLELHAPTPDDADFINPAIVASHASLSPWMSWARTVPTHDETKLYVRKTIVEWDTRESLDYRLFFGGNFVGNCAIHSIEWSVPKAQIGYWLHADYQGKGIVSEAVTALTQFGFEEVGLKRLEIRCNARNIASANVAKRAGFELEAHLKNFFRGNNGELNDTLVFARTSL